MTPKASYAQTATGQQNANGTNIILNDPVSYTVTTSATGTAGYALWAQNGGVITGNSPLLNINAGASSAIVVQSGGRVSLGDGNATVSINSEVSGQGYLISGAGSVLEFNGVTASQNSIFITQGMQISSGAAVSLIDSSFLVTNRTTATTGSFSGTVVGAGSSLTVDNATLGGSTTAGNQSLILLSVSGTLIGQDLTLQFNKFNTAFNGSVMMQVSNGGSANLTNLTVNDQNTGISGISVLNNSTLVLSGGAITVGAGALVSNGNGALITATDVSATITRNNQAVVAGNGGTLNMIGGSVTAQTTGSTAVTATSTNSTVNLTGTTITQRQGATSSGSQSYMLYASGTNAVITADGITALGGVGTTLNLTGAYATTNGRIDIRNNSNITINGALGSNPLAAGVWAAGTGSRISVANSTISTTGIVSGVRADAGNIITLNTASISTIGTNATGLFANGAAAQIISTAGTSVTTSGLNSPGMTLTNGGSVNLTDTTVSATGMTSGGGAAGVLLGTGATNTAILTNSTLTSTQAAAIAIFTGATNITASNTSITGPVLMDVSNTSAASLNATDASLLSGRIVTAAGASSTLSLASGSMWTMTASSNLTSLTMDAGTLRYGASAILTSTNPITLNSGGGTFDTNGFDSTLGLQIEGGGALTKTGAGTLVLNGANTYGGGTQVAQGTLQVGSASTTSLTSLGTGTVNIASGATLAAVTNGPFTFANTLTGSGLLTASNAGQAFTFDAAAGTAFAGTVALANNTFSLSGSNTAALANGTLRLDTGNVTTVGDGNQTIHGLAFNGGTAVFAVTVPADIVATSTITTTGDLDISGTGTVRITVPASGFNNTQPLPNTSLPLLEQDDQNALVQLVSSTGTVTGSGGALILTDQNGVAISNARVVDITQNSLKVAEGTYDYRLISSVNGSAADGLYVGYGLTQINLIGSGSNALELAPATGATGVATDLSARLTGAGDLAVLAGSGHTVSLSNALSDYTGITDVRSGTLLMAANNALGLTSNLMVTAGAAFDTAGYSQAIGELNTAVGSRVTIAPGSTLSIVDAQRNSTPSGGFVESNTLFGSGSLVIDPSIVSVNGAQAGYSGQITVEGGSQLKLNTANAFDNAGITLATASDVLIFGDLSAANPGWTGIPNGTAAMVLSGLGVVEILDTADVTLTGNNTVFAGKFDIASGTFLRAAQANNLGTASILADGTFNAIANSNWQLDNVVTGTGTVLKTGSGILTVDQALASFTGLTDVAAGTLVVGDARMSGSFIGGNANVAPGATLSGTGTIAGDVENNGTISALNALAAHNQAPASNLAIEGVLTNSGKVQLGGLAVGNTITLGGINGQGGTFVLNTVLGSDNSATDKIIVNGGAVTGSSFLSIVNQGGLGAQTTGNGIAVVEARNGATTQANSFTLSGRVAAGAYEYNLARGDQSGSGDGWYLRTPEPDPINPAPAPTNGLRPEIPTNAAIAPLASEFGYAMLGTLHERTGGAFVNADPAYEERKVYCKDAAQNFRCVVRVPVQQGNDSQRFVTAGWARIFADHGEKNSKNFTRSGADYDYTLGGAQVGLDIYAREQADGTLDKAGIYVGYGQVSANIRGINGGKAGTVDLDATSVGAYWTHYAASGWYTDAVIQGTWYSADARSVKGEQIKPDGFGFMASLEGGYSFKLGSGWVIEPQAQLIYQNISFDQVNDSFGTFRFQNSDSLRGRLGVRVARNWNMGDEAKPRMITAWLRANVWHEFKGDYKTTVATLNGTSPYQTNTALGGTWGEIGAGVNAQVTDNISLFATGAYQHSLDNKGRQGWNGRLGINVKW